MTAQELYEIVRKEIDVRAFYDPNYRAIQKKIDEQKADFNDTARLSKLLSQILGEKLAKHILELPPDEGRSELCQQLLKDFFDEINHKLAQVQSSLDKKNGISLNPVQPSFPTERVQNVAGSLNDTTEPDSTIQRRCRNAVSNVANAMHDSFIQVNAKFRNNAGLFVQVTRTGGAECCDWCAQVSGTFWGYNRDLREVFRRHDNCTCTITYSSSKTRSRLVGESDGAGGTTNKWVESQKSWQEKPILPDVHPTRFTPEQAHRKELITQAKKDDTIKVAGVRQGEPMDFEKADARNPNPLFGKNERYGENCQASVLAYDARRRGFDVFAKPFIATRAFKQLSEKPQSGWKDPDTGKPPASVFNESPSNLLKLLESLKTIVQVEQRYIFTFYYHGQTSGGHVTIVEKDAKGLFIYDAQSGEIYRNLQLFKYILQMDFERNLQLFRIDNMELNTDILNETLGGN